MRQHQAALAESLLNGSHQFIVIGITPLTLLKLKFN